MPPGARAQKCRYLVFCRGSARRQGTANTTVTRTSPAQWTLRISAGCSMTAAISSKGCTSNSTSCCEAPGPLGAPSHPFSPLSAAPSIPGLPVCQPQTMVESSELPSVIRLPSVSCSVSAPFVTTKPLATSVPLRFGRQLFFSLNMTFHSLPTPTNLCHCKPSTLTWVILQ